MKFSIIILYFNRTELLNKIINNLININNYEVEIIVVDNHSEIDLSNYDTIYKHNIKYLRLDNNYGAVARNYGIKAANGEYIVCLDDDIIGIFEDDLKQLVDIFYDATISAVCFKVINPINKQIMNWSHHYDERLFSNKQFDTNEISEGAVAFRKKTLDITGVYYDKYFISHEGPDLACRIINHGFRIVFSPKIIVEHHHSDIGRKSWRRYYYDTRNLIWLNLRNYPILTAARKILFGTFAMFVYSLRDGFVIYWFKGIVDSLAAYSEVYKSRVVMSSAALKYVKQIESNRPSFIFYLTKRLFKRKVQI